MANYELPQVRVFQELDPRIESSERMMLPTIIGERRDLLRYSNADEKELGEVGSYTGSLRNILWPNLGGNSTVLGNTVRLHGENAMVAIQTAEYMDNISVISPIGDSFDPADYFTPLVDGRKNIFVFSTLNLESEVSLLRPPKAGDYIRIHQHSSGVTGWDDFATAVWDAQVIDTVYSLEARANDGVGTVSAWAHNAATDTAVVDSLEVNSDEVSEATTLTGEFKIVCLDKFAYDAVTVGTLVVNGETCVRASGNEFSYSATGGTLDIAMVSTAVGDSWSLTIDDGVDSYTYSNTTNSLTPPTTGWTQETEGGPTAVVTFTPAAAEDQNPSRKYLVEQVANKLSSYGLTSIDDMNYSIQVVDVGDTDVTLAISSRFYNDVVVVSKSKLVLSGNYVFYAVNEPGSIIPYPNATSVPLGGVVIDDLFQLYFEKTGEDATITKNDLITLTGNFGFAKQEYDTTDSKPSIVADSVYESNSDTTYTIEVVRGGAKDLADGSATFDPTIEFRVSSSDASDHVHTARGIIANGAITIPVGSKGISVKFNATADILALAKGDYWTLPCTGRKADVLVGVVTDKNFPYFANLSTQSLDLEFLAKLDTVVIPKLQLAGTVDNWDINDDGDGITLQSGVKVPATNIDPDLEGEAYLSSADLFMEYTAVNSTHSNTVLTMATANDEDGITELVGIDDPANPLGYGVRKAMSNSQGIPVIAVPVDDVEDQDSVSGALAKLSNSNSAYQLVPLTFNQEIQDDVIAHALEMSTETMDRWRVAYISTDIGHEYGVVTTDAAGAEVQATFTEGDDGLFNKVSLDDSIVDVSFIARGIKAGDTVRYNYEFDMYGNEVYSQFAVLDVLTATDLLVLGDYGQATGAPIRIEIYRDTTAADVSEVVGSRSEGLFTRRVNNVFPPVLTDDADRVVPGYFAAAALAGLAAGVNPHQGLTNSKLIGFKDASALAPASRLGLIQLNELASHGVTILVGDNYDVGIRHELTTCMLDRKNRETMVTRNLDSISYKYFDGVSPFIGLANVTPEFLDKLRTELTSLSNYIISASRRPLIGSQMISYSIVSVEQDPVLSDKINMYIRPILPFPFNYGDIHIQI